MNPHWSEVRIAGKLADVFVPPDALDGIAILYLHGHGCERLPSIERITPMLTANRVRLIAPQGGRCWWLDRTCTEFDPALTPAAFLNDHVVPWCVANWNVDTPYIGLLGLSMGGQGALNLAYRSGGKFPVVAAVSPAVDFHIVHGRGWPLDELFDSPEAARQQTATLNIHPFNWPKFHWFCCDPLDRAWHDGCERLASKLSSMGMPYEADLTTSLGGHNWDYFATMIERVLPRMIGSLRDE